MDRRIFFSAGLVLCLTDTAAILLACGLGFFLRYASSASMPFEPYLLILPWLFVFPLFYAAFSLYPGTLLRRQEELKRQCIATSLGFVGIAFVFFLAKEGHMYSRMTLLLAWTFALFFLPLFRCAARLYFSRFCWWKTPCVLFASEDLLEDFIKELLHSPHPGLLHVALVLDESSPLPDLRRVLGPANAIVVERVPLRDEPAAQEALARIARRYRNPYAILRQGFSACEERQRWLNVVDRAFRNIILIPDTVAGGRIWTTAASVGPFPGLLLRQNLLDPRRMTLKRGIDILFTLTLGLFLFPLLFLLALAIRIDSSGAPVFSHRRLGRNGVPFNVYKFRTMADNADEILKRHLENNPKARREWEETQKLKDDPRITRVGAFLRKTSLDELPQILNVLKGDMSLVGPRPIVDAEVEKYGEDYALYTRVRPGVTGLWQVSGRNNVSYEERVRLDHYYVCNWSVWLDILILARTLPEVLRCTGAY